MTPRILVDADACPVKDEIYKLGLRHAVPVVIVANSYIRIPEHPLISRRIVSDGFDAADDWIAGEGHALSVVITADIPHGHSRHRTAIVIRSGLRFRAARCACPTRAWFPSRPPGHRGGRRSGPGRLEFE